MRYAIFADIHANLDALEVVLAACKKAAIDEYLCAGDVVGYAAQPGECIDRIEADGVTVVAGNHDWAVVKLYPSKFFNPIARQALLWTREHISCAHCDFLGNLKLVFKNRDLTLVHGTLDYPEDFNYLADSGLAENTFNLLDKPVCFVGHTHVPGVFEKDKSGIIHHLKDNSINLNDSSSYIINVGSVGQPRDSDPRAAYCIYDSEKKEAMIKRADYDIRSANSKILSHGLPAALGERLFLGS
ncbi:MAG TPA: metallophosphoesterase family protein [Candidatus Margulisiibacteriota bacterium]|nr:metallophosphoesterase family protein [Candidatus Margulisiibacteriota bacterium]